MELIYFLTPFLRIILGLVLVVSSILKFPNLRKFSVIVAAYGLLPRQLVKPLSHVQPVFELFAGIWILSGVYLFFAALAGLAIMLLADLFVLFALLKKKNMDNCGCYGTAIKVPLTWKKLAENLLLTLFFIMLIILAL